MRGLFGVAAVALLWAGSANAQCPPLPVLISNGQPADATKVMQDLDHLRDCLNGDVGTISTPSVSIESPAGPTATIKAPTVTSAYDFNLPATAGSAGQVLTSAGAGSPMVWSAGGGGGGGRAPVSDGYPTARPVVADLSWINPSNASLVDHASGPVTMRLETAGSGSFHMVESAVPSQLFTITAKIICPVNSGVSCGVFVRDVGNRMVFMGFKGTTFGIGTAASTSGSNLSMQNTASVSNSPSWFRISRDATFTYYSWSANGADWVQTAAIANTSGYLTGTIAAAGVLGLPTSSLPALIPIWSLEIKSGTGTDSSWQ